MTINESFLNFPVQEDVNNKGEVDSYKGIMKVTIERYKHKGGIFAMKTYGDRNEQLRAA